MQWAFWPPLGGLRHAALTCSPFLFFHLLRPGPFACFRLGQRRDYGCCYPLHSLFKDSGVVGAAFLLLKNSFQSRSAKAWEEDRRTPNGDKAAGSAVDKLSASAAPRFIHRADLGMKTPKPPVERPAAMVSGVFDGAAVAGQWRLCVLDCTVTVPPAFRCPTAWLLTRAAPCGGRVSAGRRHRHPLQRRERFDVEEYCVSEGWIKVPAGKTVDRGQTGCCS